MPEKGLISPVQCARPYISKLSTKHKFGYLNLGLKAQTIGLKYRRVHRNQCFHLPNCLFKT